jgi:hypothetical protein
MNHIDNIMALADTYALIPSTTETYERCRQALRAAIEKAIASGEGALQALAVQPEPVKDIGYEQDERVFARIAAMKKPQPKQEPVATKTEQGITLHVGWNDLPADTKLYTAPHPQREWVEMTNDEIEDCWDGYLSDYQLQQIREMIAKLRKKNRGTK